MKRVKPLDVFRDLVSDENVEPALEAALRAVSGSFRGADAWIRVENQLDELAEECSHGDLARASKTLFGSSRLSGDKSTYDDPRNSFLDHCFETGRGLPITLCIIGQRVMSRVGVSSHLIGLPGHVVWSDDAPMPVRRFFDPFNGGRELSREQCLTVASMAGRPGREDDLAPMTNRSVLVRILNNLARTYRRSGDVAALSLCVGYRWAMPEIRRLDGPQTLALVRELN